MKPIRILAGLALIFLLITGCGTTGPTFTGQQAMKISTPVTRMLEMQYLLYLPDDYQKSDKDYPLVLFLHGSGERGNDIEKVKIHGPARLAAEGKSFPFILVSPQCPDGQWWNAEDLMSLLQELKKSLRVDEKRIIVTGLSMGGFGTFDLIAKYPQEFAAALPVCGGGEPRAMRVIGTMPVWVFHGAKDPVVDIKRSQDMVDAIKSFGGNVQFTIYPEAGHDSWTETYNNPKIYEWMMEQKRP